MAIGTDPFADLLTLQRDMDRIMTKFGGQPRQPGEDGHGVWMPSVDIYKQGEDMIVRVELPGVSPGDINVSVTGNMLTVKGERRAERTVEDSDYVMRESTFGSFERRVTMPQDIDASQIRAQYRAGVLEITIPSSALIAQTPRSVAVTPAGQQAMGGAQPAAPQTQQGYGYGQPQSGYTQGTGQPAQTGYPSQEPPMPSQQGEQEPAQQMPPVQAQGGWTPPTQSSTPSEQQMGTSYQYEGQQAQGGQPEQGTPVEGQTAEEQQSRRGWFRR